MRAWTYRTRGPPSVALKLESDIPTPPPPTKGNVLIKISHSALTPSCAHLINIVPSLPFLSRPYIPELDFAGVVELAGPDVSVELKPGTQVWGSIPLVPNYIVYGAGSMAEYTVLPAICVAPVPKAKAFGLAEAAALNGNGQTAALMVKNAGIKQGSRVFVNGGSGGVGTLAVQIAKAEGAYVIATGSGPNVDLVKRLGADEVCLGYL
jgi:NADPH:quinone reductase-like Zn-dependent oxidoreductase